MHFTCDYGCEPVSSNRTRFLGGSSPWVLTPPTDCASTEDELCLKGGAEGAAVRVELVLDRLACRPWKAARLFFFEVQALDDGCAAVREL